MTETQHTGIFRVFDGGPFSINIVLYRLGFDWRTEYELQPGYSQATWDVPSWAPDQSGIVGEWHPRRRRLVYRGIPITPWERAA